MQNYTFPLLTLVTIGLFGTTPLVHADDLALDLASAQPSVSCFGCGSTGTTLGWSFLVNSEITVDGIGVWDDTSAPFGTPAVAGIFDDSGDLLASAAISSASTPVASSNSDGQWLFESIAPLVLAPGEYEIGSLFFDGAPLGELNPSFTTIPQITVFGPTIGSIDSGLQAPLTPFPDFFFGATFEVAPSVVPEPAMFGFLIVGIAAMILRRAKVRGARTLACRVPLQRHTHVNAWWSFI
jgi:hypothetical protein